MKRTRRWEFVKQEALRLAGLGLSPTAIAHHVNVDPSTCRRWRREGRLTKPTRPVGDSVATLQQSPREWALSVASTYQLDSTDEQLVILAESTLAIARDSASSWSIRLQAMRAFQSLTRQLWLGRARLRDDVPQESPAEAEKQKRREIPAPTSGDPRRLLVMTPKPQPPGGQAS